MCKLCDFVNRLFPFGFVVIAVIGLTIMNVGIFLGIW